MKKYWNLFLCWLIGHTPYTHKDAANFLAGKKTKCPRCKKNRFP